MPKVVSNTTPLISLLKIGKLEILRDLYGEILVPQEVFNEIEAGRTKEFYIDISKTGWIRIEKIKDPRSLAYFLDLDKGEAEAIVLAVENNADLILLDETLGRFHAKHAGLKMTGTIGILLKAKQKGYISELKPLLYELRKKNVWISESLMDEILLLANEKL
jgi:predicted nucleic acid-binding protein